jgi:hypothetical protein
MEDHPMKVNKKKAIKAQISAYFAIAGQTAPNLMYINDDVAKIFVTMLVETRKCTDKITWIPTAPFPKPSVGWLIMNIQSTISDKIADEYSISCIKRIIWTYKNPLIIAGMNRK